MRTELLSQTKPDTLAEDPLIAIPLEVAEDFSKWTEEMQDTLLTFSTEELRQFYGEEQSPDTVEQHNRELPFKPETVYNVGAVGLAMVMTPEMFNREIERAAFDKIADNEEEKVEENTPGSYAQEKSEYQEYVAQAESLVGSLTHGDESGLSAVPARFQEALSVRMNQRRNELQDGTMTQGEFELECKKMISVACIGLRKKAEGEEV